MSSVNIFDSSAILATLLHETGEDAIESAFEERPAWITAVNLCEVLGKLCDKGMPIDEAQDAIDNMGMIVVDFDAELGRLAAAMRARTAPIGASLGDRACLALAERTLLADSKSVPVVYTADRSWTKLKWPFKIVVVRTPRSNA